ncbi:hypothetical protein RND81_05G184300 [Saponaria officinalis]|uniref:BHLH domain-containing protein n=1 Tax=Saponaria officinalis TaxID=3572 RepID=A0AAW1KTM0_SAPOF
MLAMSPCCPSLGWEYPMELGSLPHESIHLDNYWNHLDSLVFLPNNNNNNNNNNNINNNNFTSNQIENDDHRDDDDQTAVKKRRCESAGSASSGDHICGNVLTKKLNHNASERDRRKKINNLYSTLRSMLPLDDHSKKLSIPSTVGRVLKYIPELQKEVDDLIHRKDELLSKCSLLQGVTSELFKEEKSKIKDISKNKHSCSISASKLGDHEIIIQISSLDDKISLSDVLLKLEMDGLVVLDISSFQSFGGSTFYNIHLWIERSNNNVNCEMLNEELPYFVQKQNMNTNTNTNTNININMMQTYGYY